MFHSSILLKNTKPTWGYPQIIQVIRPWLSIETYGDLGILIVLVCGVLGLCLSYNRIHFIMVYAGHYGLSTGWIVRLLGNWMQLSVGKAAVPASQLLLSLSGKSKKTLTQILRFILTASNCHGFSVWCFSFHIFHLMFSAIMSQKTSHVWDSHHFPPFPTISHLPTAGRMPGMRQKEAEGLRGARISPEPLAFHLLTRLLRWHPAMAIWKSYGNP